MCLEDAKGWQAKRLDEDGAQGHGWEGSATAEAEEPVRGVVLGCSGCAELGYCRRGLGQEESLPDCTGH